MDGQLEVLQLQFLEDSVTDEDENAEEPVYIVYHYEYDYDASSERSWIPHGMQLDKGLKARGNYMLLWGVDFASSTDTASILRMTLDGGVVDWAYTF